VAYITYENFPYLLSDEIRNRKELSNKLFEENELWYLIYTLLSASLTYHQKGVKTGDIRPDNIFINEDGQVKVASVDSWPG
jgi:serine/threonine protein kinase